MSKTDVDVNVDEVVKLIEDVYGKRSETGASAQGTQNAGGVESTSRSIPVNSKELLMKVLLDTAENYSVSGYAKRAKDCFDGNIYLGLDKGEEYERQATKVNQAIMRVTGAEAFALALQETRTVLAGGAADDLSVTVKVLAGLCRHWFDLPDGVHMDTGRRNEVVPEVVPPPQCPGDFTYPSGYIFNPDPGETPGPGFGALLMQAVLRFVAELRAANRLPNGVLSRAVFEAFPSGEDDLVARTIIGVMMGKLPTTTFNVFIALSMWRANGAATFTALQQALGQHGERDPYLRASAALKQPLIQAIQLKPVPPAIWRTATKPHTLGTDQVNPGDIIEINIANATREDFDACIIDAFPVFGGDRRATPHPTHACPGYEMAFGIMLGIINGLMEPA